MKVLGYGYRLSGETISQALIWYKGISGEIRLNRTYNAALAEIKSAKKQGSINQKCKPKIFKICVIEDK